MEKNIRTIFSGSNNLEIQSIAYSAGQFAYFPPNSTNMGISYTKADGTELDRSVEAILWQKALLSGWVISEADWQAKKLLSYNGAVMAYSDGDGSTTFRKPDVGTRGAFARAIGSGDTGVEDLLYATQDQDQEWGGRIAGLGSASVGVFASATGVAAVDETTNTLTLNGSDATGTTRYSAVDLTNATQIRTGDESKPISVWHEVWICTGRTEAKVPVQADIVTQIAEASNAKNILINTCFDADTVVNQREFDGDWSALSVGDYGYDMWFKYSETQIAQIVEEGTYKKGAVHTMMIDGVVAGKIAAPMSGHWEIVVPIGSNYLDLYAGDFTRSWQPESSPQEESMKRFIVDNTQERLPVYLVGSNSIYRNGAINFPVIMKRVPDVSATYSAATVTSTIENVNMFKFSVQATVNDQGAGMSVLSYVADATLTSADASQTDIIL